MIWVDWVLAAALVLSIAIGIWRGFTREMLGLASWILSILAALWFAPTLAPLFAPYIETPSIRLASAYATLFVAGLVTGALVTAIVSSLVRQSPLSGVDRAIGAGFGLVRGLLLATVLVWLVGQTPAKSDPWWRESKLVGPLQELAAAAGRAVPDRWAAKVSESATVAREGI